MDKELGQHQNSMKDNNINHTEFYLYQQAQQWQQERLELKQDLTLICQYLRSLAERQEQLWLQTHINHEQVINEFRQNFQFLSSLIANTVEPQADSRHVFHIKENQLMQDVTETGIRDGSMLPKHLGNINRQDNASAQEAHIIGSQNKMSGECNVTTNVMTDPEREQGREMPENHRKSQDMQYQKQDSDFDWKLENPNAWPVNGQSKISGSSDKQKNIQKVVHKSHTQLLETKIEDEELGMRQQYKSNTISKVHDDFLKPLHPLQSLPVAALEHQHKVFDNTRYLDGQTDKPWGDIEQKGSSQTFNEQDKHLENTKEQVRSMDSKPPPRKMYVDAVLAGSTSSNKLKINLPSEENTLDWPTSEFDMTNLPESQDSFEGTGFYAEVISKLMNNRTPSPTSSIQSNVSSNSRTCYRSARKDFTQSETTDSKPFSTPPKENIENLQKKVPVECIPESGAVFKIINSRDFSVSNKVFLTPYLYTRSKLCKVRVRTCFNKAGYLNAFIHVARGAFDDKHKWPIHLSGNGSILHNGSKLFTPLWHLNSSTCSVPQLEKEEVILKTVVCLSSTRNQYPDVTYKDLEKMQFAGNNCLTFKWNLKVERG